MTKKTNPCEVTGHVYHESSLGKPHTPESLTLNAVYIYCVKCGDVKKLTTT